MGLGVILSFPAFSAQAQRSLHKVTSTLKERTVALRQPAYRSGINFVISCWHPGHS